MSLKTLFDDDNIVVISSNKGENVFNGEYIAINSYGEIHFSGKDYRNKY